MFNLHCTGKLRDRLKRPLSSRLQTGTTILGSWYATVLFWKPQVVLLVNARTLLPVSCLSRQHTALSSESAPLLRTYSSVRASTHGWWKLRLRR